jgi:nucleotide-binding universal stress UspA family protein
MSGIILVAVNDSPSAFKAADAAVDCARRLGGRVHAVTVIDNGELGRHLGYADPAALAVRREQAADAGLRHVSACGAAAGVEVSVARRTGRVAAEILAEAQEIGADLIVISRVEHRGHAIPHVGGNTLRVLEFSDVPVLVVPADPPA